MKFFALLRKVGASVFVFALVFAMSFAPRLMAQTQPVPQSAPGPQTVPEAPPMAPPPPVEFLNRIPADQISFLNDYANKTTKELRKDKRFKELLKLVVPRTTFHYGSDMSLSDAVNEMLNGQPLPVDVREGRYVLVTSSGGPYLHGRGFVWFDMQEGIGIGGVYFRPTNGEPTPTLAVFSRQWNTDALAWSQLPAAFVGAVGEWSQRSFVPIVPVTYFIPEKGAKYPLIHDLDYCGAGSVYGADPVRCEQLNAEAADVDMNGAYFMAESGNAANATAWRLGPDQVAWVGMRARTCGAALACQIRVTRMRTMVLIHRR
jgi:hypothetical protein